MSTSPNSTVQGLSNGERSCGRWSGLNIAGMVIGFILFWPVGLVILGWIMSGRNVSELFALVREKVSGILPSRENTSYSSDHSDNEVFDAYQQTQVDRIREIKDEIKNRSKRFGEFRAAAKRRADEEEFNRFMSDTPLSEGR